MKKWLKKIKNDDVNNILKNIQSEDLSYKVPSALDEEIKRNLNIMSKKTESEKPKKIPVIYPRLAFACCLILIITAASILITQILFTKKSAVLMTSGDVYIKKINKKDWKKINIKEKIPGNVIIKTDKDSSLTLSYSKNVLIKVQNNSVIEIPKTKKDSIKLIKGKLLVNVYKNSPFEVLTKDVAYSVKGTKFIVEQDTSNEYSKLSVKEGLISIKNRIDYMNEIKELKKKHKNIDNLMDDFFKKEIIISKNKNVIIYHENINKINNDVKDILNTVKTYDEKTYKENLDIIKDKINNLNLKNNEIITANTNEINEDEWEKGEYSFFKQDEFFENISNKTGKLLINAGKGSATVFINEKQIIRGENEISLVLPAEQIIKLKITKDGYNDFNTNIKLKSKETKNITVKWEKSESSNIEISDNVINNFENNMKPFTTDNEWGIIEDENNNHVLTPIKADLNSDLFMTMKRSDNIIMKFKFKRLPGKKDDCMMKIDFGSNLESNRDNDVIVFVNTEIIIFNRSMEPYTYILYDLDFNRWYSCKITFTDGNFYTFYLDNKKVLTYKKKEKSFFNNIKFEGHPETSKWYLDDFYLQVE